MSREIKFRCWNISDYDENDNPIWEMIDAENLAFSSFELLKDQLKINEESEIFMQFTGFTDKNGKEIYEGDIISDKTETSGVFTSKKQVFWNQSTGSWVVDNSINQDQSSSTELWLELHDYEYEVIGDIYTDLK